MHERPQARRFSFFILYFILFFEKALSSFSYSNYIPAINKCWVAGDQHTAAVPNADGRDRRSGVSSRPTNESRDVPEGIRTGFTVNRKRCEVSVSSLRSSQRRLANRDQ